MNYEDIFRERGGSYHQAMRLWPDARREEFLLPVQWAGLAGGETVVDVPAGGGYLRRYLPASCTWLGHEPCGSFQDDGGMADTGLLPLPWADGSADAAISVAGLHHLADKRPLFRDLHRVLRPGGRFVLADVYAGSRVARFLDEFVGRHNSTGHRGFYLDERSPGELESSGFQVLRSGRVNYCWWFPARRDMGTFCRRMFDIRGLDDGEIAGEMEEYLGITSRDGRTGLNWELFLVLCRRPATGETR